MEDDPRPPDKVPALAPPAQRSNDAHDVSISTKTSSGFSSTTSSHQLPSSTLPFPASPSQIRFQPTTRVVENDSTSRPLHLLMRSRRISTPLFSHQEDAASRNRTSIASCSSRNSFDSLPEEDDGLVESSSGQSRGREPLSRSNSANKRFSLSTTPAPVGGQRLSLVGTTALPSVSSLLEGTRPRRSRTRTQSSARSPLSLSRRNSALESEGEIAGDDDKENVGRQLHLDNERQQKNDQKRWKVAQELLETERAYSAVLEEIDEYFYQPLLASLPLSDPLVRRMSTRRPAADSPTDTLDSDAVISRRLINIIFSNFTDVVNLSKVMLSTLEEALSLTPASAPVPVPLARSESNTRPPLLPSSLASTPENSSPSSYAASSMESTRVATSARALRRRSTTTSASSRPQSAAPALPLDLCARLLPLLPFLKQYSLFIANFSSSLALLSALESTSQAPSPLCTPRDREKWQSFIESRAVLRAQGGRSQWGLGLASMLLNVVQRVPRYKLLLLELRRATDLATHPDGPALERCVAVVEGVAQHLESQIRAHEASLALLTLQRALVFPASPLSSSTSKKAQSCDDFTLVVPGRRIVRFGRVKKKDRKGALCERTIVLLSDLLIVAVSNVAGEDSISGLKGDETLSVKMKVELEDVTVTAAMTPRGDTSRSFGFEVRTTDKSFVALVHSQAEQEAWIEAVRDTKSALLSDRTTLWQPTQHSPSPTRPTRERRMSMPIKLGVNVGVRLIPPTPLAALDEPEDPFLLASPARSPENEVSPAETVYPILPPSHIYSAPVWLPDTDPRARACRICHEPFVNANASAPVALVMSATMWWKRRHHCRLCGGVVCGKCGDKWFVVPASSIDDESSGRAGRLERACDTCFTDIFSIGDSTSTPTESTSSSDEELSTIASTDPSNSRRALQDRYATRRVRTPASAQQAGTFDSVKFNTITRQALLESSITLLRSPEMSSPSSSGGAGARRRVVGMQVSGSSDGNVEKDGRVVRDALAPMRDRRKSGAGRRLESILLGGSVQD